jgi:transcriptional regulator with XRE-family HTH domain
MTKNAKSLTDEITSTREGMRLWQQERCIFTITERLCELMEEKGVSRKELAERLGKSRSYVTQVLSGTPNLTIRSISDLYLALDRQFIPDDGAVSTAYDHGPVIARFSAFGGDNISPTRWKVAQETGTVEILAKKVQ